MKNTTLTIAFILSMLVSCEDEEPKTTGCVTAADKVTNEIIFLRCSTIADFNKTDLPAYAWDTTDSLYYHYEFNYCRKCK